MKKLLAGLLLIPCLARAEFYTGNDLLTKLNSASTIEQTHALGYVMGVYDVYVDVTICSPRGVTSGQVRDMVQNYLTNIPAQRHKTAESLINQALKQAWPCPQRNPGRGT